jgi:hypothetical protein
MQRYFAAIPPLVRNNFQSRITVELSLDENIECATAQRAYWCTHGCGELAGDIANDGGSVTTWPEKIGQAGDTQQNQDEEDSRATAHE